MDPHDLPRGPEELHAGEPGAAPPGVETLGADGPLTVLAADGAHALAPATIDSDADGTVDTAFVPAPGPASHELFALATDLDHDGVVDVLTTVSSDGSARSVDTSGDDAWEPGWDAAAPPAAVLDPATGAWTRSA